MRGGADVRDTPRPDGPWQAGGGLRGEINVETVEFYVLGRGAVRAATFDHALVMLIEAAA